MSWPFTTTKSNHWAFIDGVLRLQLCKQMADKMIGRMSEKEIVAYCPKWFGQEYSKAHRDHMWEQIFEEYNSLDDYTLSRKVEDILQPEGQVAESFRMGRFIGNSERLN